MSAETVISLMHNYTYAVFIRSYIDDRPLMWTNSNGHISARGRLIHFVFGSRVGFSGLVDQMALFSV